jgi:pimeloyl-ACP methyl ester carboxylesterase
LSKVFSADGTAIAYHRSGAGQPVILVGGAFNDAQSSAPLAELLARQLTVVIFDRRGRGASADTPPYAVAREVEDIAALIDGLGGQARLCGFSSGAILAFEAAAAGLDIPGLAMFEPPFRPPGSPQLPPDYLEQMVSLTAAGRNGDAVAYFMAKAVGLPPDAVGQMRRRPSWPAMAALAPTAVYDGILVGDASVPVPRLAALTTSALLLDSSGSAPWLHAATAATAAALPNATHRTLDGTFHHIPPDILAPVLAAFFLP